jgi:ribosomal protein S18 acetylase RimI-like enzyme
VQVRPARVGDAAAIAEVQVRTWQTAYAHTFGQERLAAIDLEARRRNWRRRLSEPAPDWRQLVAEDDDGRVVAFAAAGDSGDDEATGELYAIYALPETWGSGAGPALMAQALEALRESGYREAVLWVLEDNPRARRFYEREGWALDGARREGEHLGVATAEVRYRIALA